MEFYKRNFFIFNPNFIKSFNKEIIPSIKSPEGLYNLFANESLKIKTFIYEFENEILKDYNDHQKNFVPINVNNKLVDSSQNNFNSHLEKIRKYILNYFSKMINFSFDLFLPRTIEISLVKSEIGFEGAVILSIILSKNKNISSLNLSRSKIKEDELNLILVSVENILDYFTLNITGIFIPNNNLKYIKRILSNDVKKRIIFEKTGNSKFSKLTSENNKRLGKIRIKNNY